MAATGSGAEPRPTGDRALLSAFANAPIGMAVLTPAGVITALIGAPLFIILLKRSKR